MSLFPTRRGRRCHKAILTQGTAGERTKRKLQVLRVLRTPLKKDQSFLSRVVNFSSTSAHPRAPVRADLRPLPQPEETFRRTRRLVGWLWPPPHSRGKTPSMNLWCFCRGPEGAAETLVQSSSELCYLHFSPTFSAISSISGCFYFSRALGHSVLSPQGIPGHG